MGTKRVSSRIHLINIMIQNLAHKLLHFTMQQKAVTDEVF